MTRKEALKKVIQLCENQILFAAALTKAVRARGLDKVIKQQHVSYWLNSVTGLPSEYCIDTEELPEVNFAVTRHQLRPDVFGTKPYTPIDDATANISTNA